MDTTTIVEANAVETRKGVGRRTDTPREIETETGSVTQTAQEIDTGIVAVIERVRGGSKQRVRGGRKPSGDSNQQHQLLALQQVHGEHFHVMGTHRMLHKQAATRATGTRQILATTSSMQEQAMRRSKGPALLPTSKCEIST